MVTCPCRGCVAPTRHEGCHARCKAYIDWKAARDEAKHERYQDKIADSVIIEDFVVRKIRRRKRFGRR